MPQGATAVSATLTAAKAVTNITAATAGVSLKTGKGVLNGVSINTGATTSTVVIYDGTSTAGTKLGTFAATAQFNAILGWAFTVGLFVVVTGTPDVTVSYT